MPRVIRVEPHGRGWMYYYKFEWRPDVNRFSFQPSLRFNMKFFAETVPRDFQVDLIRPAPGSGKLVAVTNLALRPVEALDTRLLGRELAKETFYLRVWSMRPAPATLDEAVAQPEATGVTLAVWQSEGVESEPPEAMETSAIIARQPDFSTSPDSANNKTTAAAHRRAEPGRRPQGESTCKSIGDARTGSAIHAYGRRRVRTARC